MPDFNPMPHVTAQPEDRCVVATVVAGHMLATLVSIVLVPALPAMTAHFGALGSGRMVVQSVVLLPLASTLIGAPVAGFVGDRIGYRITLRLLLLLFAISGASGTFASNIVELAAGRIILGLSSGGIVAICSAITGRRFSGPRRERVLGFSYAAASLATVAAFPLSGMLVDAFGWRAPFGMYLIGFVVFVFAQVAEAPPSEIDKSGSRRVFPTGIVGVLFVSFVFGVGYQVLSAQGPFIFAAAGISTAFALGAVGACAGAATMTAAGLYGRMQSRIGASGTILVAVTLLSISIVLMTVADSIQGIAGVVLIFGFGAGLSSPALNSVVLTASSPRQRGSASGLMVSALSLGQFANPLIYSAIETVVRPPLTLAAIGALVAIAGLTISLILRGGQKVAPSEAEIAHGN